MLAPDLIQLAKTVKVYDLISADTPLRGGPIEKFGACPRCGGSDRLHVNMRQNAWFCRKCTGEPSTDGWKDAIDYIMFRSGMGFVDAVNLLTSDKGKLTEGDRMRMAKERAEAQAKQEREEREFMLAQRQKLWAQDPPKYKVYHRCMTQEQRQAWYDRGLDDPWINYYQVGYATDLTFPRGNGNPWTGHSLTIPVLRTLTSGGVKPVTVMCRLIGEQSDKYRPIMSGLGKQMFVSRYNVTTLEGTCLLVEGEIKAMVTYAYMKGLTTHVIGLAGKSPKQEHIKSLRSFDHVYICLDPDAAQDAVNLAWQIGPDICTIVDLPGKIDDLIVAKALNGWDMLHYLNNSRRV